MKGWPVLNRLSVVMSLVVLLLAVQGCTYLRYRAEDLADVIDLGVTFSKKPGLAVYGTCPFSLVSGLGGYVDGYFVGWGGGQIGVTRHYLKAVGIVVIGAEEIGWGDFDKEDPATLNRAYQGVLGVPLFPFIWARPAYMPACTHEVHLGWIGLVGNVRYVEVLDFALGWTTLDIACDDGKRLSRWPWRSEEGMRAEAESNRLWIW